MFTAPINGCGTVPAPKPADAEGTRRICEVLLLQRRLPAERIIAGMDAALSMDSTDPAVVAVEARRAGGAPLAQVIPLQAVRDRVDADQRPIPTLDGYDTLLEAGR